MSASDFDLNLAELQRNSVGRLVAAEVFDEQAFEALRSYLCEKAELIKHEHVVSKQVLACLLEGAAAIESRASYVEGARKHADFAAKFHSLLGLIARGEGCNDRTPGVPRVV